MNKIEIEELATATAKWLSKKRQIGLGDVFSESQLTIPVVEHLIPKGRRKFKAERNSVNVFKGKCSDVYYDLDEIKNTSKLLIELKLSKALQKQRLIKDLVKLALPPSNLGFTCLLIISEPSNGSSKPVLLDEIIKAGKVSFKLSESAVSPDNEAGVEVLVEGSKIPSKLTGDELKSVRSMMDADPTLRALTVECAAIKTAGSDRVIILKVQR
jgi:hypothetical protein